MSDAKACHPRSRCCNICRRTPCRCCPACSCWRQTLECRGLERSSKELKKDVAIWAHLEIPCPRCRAKISKIPLCPHCQRHYDIKKSLELRKSKSHEAKGFQRAKENQISEMFNQSILYDKLELQQRSLPKVKTLKTLQTPNLLRLEKQKLVLDVSSDDSIVTPFATTFERPSKKRGFQYLFPQTDQEKHRFELYAPSSAELIADIKKKEHESRVAREKKRERGEGFRGREESEESWERESDRGVERKREKDRERYGEKIGEKRRERGEERDGERGREMSGERDWEEGEKKRSRGKGRERGGERGEERGAEMGGERYWEEGEKKRSRGKGRERGGERGEGRGGEIGGERDWEEGEKKRSKGKGRERGGERSEKRGGEIGGERDWEEGEKKRSRGKGRERGGERGEERGGEMGAERDWEEGEKKRSRGKGRERGRERGEEKGGEMGGERDREEGEKKRSRGKGRERGGDRSEERGAEMADERDGEKGEKKRSRERGRERGGERGEERGAEMGGERDGEEGEKKRSKGKGRDRGGERGEERGAKMGGEKDGEEGEKKRSKGKGSERGEERGEERGADMGGERDGEEGEKKRSKGKGRDRGGERGEERGAEMGGKRDGEEGEKKRSKGKGRERGEEIGGVRDREMGGERDGEKGEKKISRGKGRESGGERGEDRGGERESARSREKGGERGKVGDEEKEGETGGKRGGGDRGAGKQSRSKGKERDGEKIGEKVVKTAGEQYKDKGGESDEEKSDELIGERLGGKIGSEKGSAKSSAGTQASRIVRGQQESGLPSISSDKTGKQEDKYTLTQDLKDMASMKWDQPKKKPSQFGISENSQKLPAVPGLKGAVSQQKGTVAEQKGSQIEKGKNKEEAKLEKKTKKQAPEINRPDVVMYDIVPPPKKQVKVVVEKPPERMVNFPTIEELDNDTCQRILKQKIPEKFVKNTKIVKNLPENRDIIIAERECDISHAKHNFLDTESIDDESEHEVKGTPKAIKYALSDRFYIDNGWTQLPAEKVVRKMFVYRSHPVQPEFDWFRNNKDKGIVYYDTGEKLAELEDTGYGRWYYKNGRIAMDYHKSENATEKERVIVYSNGEPDETGKKYPVIPLAMFDKSGNGIVFDHNGEIRINFNQSEGMVHDPSIGPSSHWKWHSLNDPPNILKSTVDTFSEEKDPNILMLQDDGKRKRIQDSDMLTVEFQNFVKEVCNRQKQKFCPFDIKMKAFKINKQFSLNILDQTKINLKFRDGSTSLKINLGIFLDPEEVVDTELAEIGNIENKVLSQANNTDSKVLLRELYNKSRKKNKRRNLHESRIRNLLPVSSADRLLAGTSRPRQYPPLHAYPN